MAFSPDGRLLATGSDDKTVRLWDPATGEHRHTLTVARSETVHADAVWSVAFSPDGRLLASGSKDDTLRLYYLTPPARRGLMAEFRRSRRSDGNSSDSLAQDTSG